MLPISQRVTLYEVGFVCQGQTVQLIGPIRTLRRKLIVVNTPFKLSLMFVSKARSPPLSGAPERCFTRLPSGFTQKDQIWLERLARDKHSSLLRTFVNYDQKKFDNNWPQRLVYFILKSFIKNILFMKGIHSMTLRLIKTFY